MMTRRALLGVFVAAATCPSSPSTDARHVAFAEEFFGNGVMRPIEVRVREDLEPMTTGADPSRRGERL